MLYSPTRVAKQPPTPDSADRPDGAQSAQLCGPQCAVRGAAAGAGEFHLNKEQVGYLTSAFLGFYMIAAPFVGPLADRYSRKLIIVLGAMFWSGLTLLTAVTHTYTELLIRHTLVGVGEATFVTIAPTFVADLFAEKKRGRILGVFYLAIPWARLRIFARRVSGAGAWVAISVLYRRGARIRDRVGGLFLKEPERGQFESLQETAGAGNDPGTGGKSGVDHRDPRHGGDDVFPRWNSGVDAAIFLQRAALHAGGRQSDVRHHHCGGWNSGVAGGRLARGLSAAAHEEFLLSGVGGEHAAGGAGHDRGIVRTRGR